MSKTSKFEEIISSAVTRLRASLSPSELPPFEAQISTPRPTQTPSQKKSKNSTQSPTSSSSNSFSPSPNSSNTDSQPSPYLSINIVAAGVELPWILSLLKTCGGPNAPHPRLLASNNKTDPHNQRTPSGLSPTLLSNTFRYASKKIEIALPEDVHRKFKNHGYLWMARAFCLTERPVHPFLSEIYLKFRPEEMPKLPRKEEEGTQIAKYVSLVME